MATIITDFDFMIFYGEKAPANDREPHPSRGIKITAEIEALLDALEQQWLTVGASS